ncbi:MAG TPA: cation:proton antiporter [Candidatus Acidoferrales bacterium]|nr:cation:proton antiporter [Candidatus Acidoferrales bacterium]
MTLPLTGFFALLGGLLVLAYVTNKLTRWTRVPDVIVLMLTGILVGPVLHWLQGSQFGEIARGFGTLALILILFAAGLELDLRHALRQFGAGLILATVSYGLTFAGVTYFCIYALALQRIPAILVGASLACMSGSIVIPVLDQFELRPPVKTTLVIEASFGDGLGALGLGVALEYAQNALPTASGPAAALLNHAASSAGHRGLIAGSVVALFLFKSLLAMAVAIVAGFLWARLLPRMSEQQFWQVLTFAAVLLVYAGTHALGGSALFGVMVFGTTLANLPNRGAFSSGTFGFQRFVSEPSHQIHFFHSELAFLVRSFFFVMLGALVEFSGLKKELLPTLGIVGVFFIARTIAIEVSRIAWRGTARIEREIAILLIPRGLITAVLALEAVAAMPIQLEFLTSLTFAVILLTSVLVLLASIRAKRLVSVIAPGDVEPVSVIPVGTRGE